MWYINKKTNELVQAIWLGEGAWANNCWGVRDKDNNWLGYLKDADFQSLYGEAMVNNPMIPADDKPHIKDKFCDNLGCIPYIPEQKQADEDPVFPICGTCNVQKEQELSDNELQEPKAGAMEMLLEATNPNCKEKPDSSLLLSVENPYKEIPFDTTIGEDFETQLNNARYYAFKRGIESELDHLAKLGGKVWYCTEKHKCKWQCFALNAGLAWGEVVDTLDAWRQYHDKECTGKLIQCIAISLSDYMKGEGK